MTFQQMCEHIVKAGILKKKDGTSPTAEEIYNYSPTGELANVFFWYREAVAKIGKPQLDDKADTTGVVGWLDG